MPVYVCVRYVGHLPVFPEVVAVLLLRFHRPGGEAAGSHFVLPVWSVCVCVVCVLIRCRRFVCCGVRVRSSPCAVCWSCSAVCVLSVHVPLMHIN